MDHNYQCDRGENCDCIYKINMLEVETRLVLNIVDNIEMKTNLDG